MVGRRPSTPSGAPESYELQHPRVTSRQRALLNADNSFATDPDATDASLQALSPPPRWTRSNSRYSNLDPSLDSNLDLHLLLRSAYNYDNFYNRASSPTQPSPFKHDPHSTLRSIWIQAYIASQFSHAEYSIAERL
ncbi:hypothetical protein NDA16_000793 [Ustilago loliicola]|nr:hypothetical protein NDA16_000793 [Ustilago loliicola]